jgi:hypothetical protein
MLSILLAFFAGAAAPPQPKPRLCLAAPAKDLTGGRCMDVDGAEIAVEPESAARAWVWMDASRQTAVLGTLAGGAGKVAVDAKPSAIMTLAGAAEVPNTFVIGAWRFTLPGDVAAHLHILAAPDGAYDLRIEAPHHLPYERSAARLSRAKPLLLGGILLKPTPVLRGRFVDAKGGPVADVAITTPGGMLLATSDPTGAVREELRERLPQRLFVRAKGFGQRTVEITRPENDFDFGTVTLKPGSTLIIHVDRHGYTGALTASLIRRNEYAASALLVRPNEHFEKWTTFASATVNRNASTTELRDLEARDYVLILRGDGPLQTLTKDVGMKDEGSTVDLSIEAHTVRGFVHQGSKVLPEVALRFAGPNDEWTSAATTDSEGHFDFDIWEKSLVSLAVEMSTGARYSSARLIGDAETEWDVDVPDRTIRGIIVDKASGRPAQVRELHLSYRLKDASGMRSVPVGDDGRFELTLLDPGHYELRASDPDYLEATEKIELQPEDRERQVRLEMQHGTEVRVLVVNAEGTPVPSAMIFLPRTTERMPQLSHTDPSGVATLRLPSNKAPLPVWVMTPSDSFAFVTLMPDAKDDPQRVALPPPVATIAVATRHADGTPAEFTQVFFGYNGVFLPSDARDYFFARGGRMVSGRDGTLLLTHMPAGEYDFYTLQTLEGYVIADPRSLGAPVHTSILPGDNRVNLIAKRP